MMERQLLKKLEWIVRGNIELCHICCNTRDQGHKPGCELKQCLENGEDTLLVELKALRREKALAAENPLKGGREGRAR